MSDLLNSAPDRSLLSLVVGAEDSQTLPSLPIQASVTDVVEMLSASPGGAPNTVIQAKIAERLQYEHKDGRLPFHAIGTRTRQQPASIPIFQTSTISLGRANDLGRWRASRTERDREGLPSLNYDDWRKNERSHDQKTVTTPAPVRMETEQIYGILAADLRKLKTRLEADSLWSVWADKWCDAQSSQTRGQFMSRADIKNTLGEPYKNGEIVQWLTLWDKVTPLCANKRPHGKYNLEEVKSVMADLGYTTQKTSLSSQVFQMGVGKGRQSRG